MNLRAIVFTLFVILFVSASWMFAEAGPEGRTGAITMIVLAFVAAMQIPACLIAQDTDSTPTR